MRPTPAAPVRSFSDSIDRGPDWLQNWRAAPSGVNGLGNGAFGDITREILADGQVIASEGGGGSASKRRVPVFDMSNTSQSFNAGPATPAPSVLGAEQRYKITDSDMCMVPNLGYVYPNGEANIVPASMPVATDSNFFGYCKQAILDKTKSAAVWGIRRKTYNIREEARRDIFGYIEMFYKLERRHSFSKQLSP